MAPRKGKVEKSEIDVQKLVLESLHNASVLQVITNIIKDTVTSAVAELHKALESNTAAVRDLKIALEERDRTISTMQNKIDDLEQYQRRQCLRIFGVEEKTNEDTDYVAIDVAQKIGVQLNVCDIDRSHRIGRRDTGRPRPIIVKFISYRKRSEVFRSKKNLKGTGITIREDLTRNRHNLLRDAITKFGVTNVWTQDGVIIAKQGDEKKRITNSAEL